MSEPFPEPAIEPEPQLEPEPEPVWSGPSQDEWTSTQQSLAYIAQALFPQQEGVAVDPFADDFQQRLDAYIDQKLTPLSSFQQEAVLSHAEEQAMEILDGFAKDDPYLLPDSMGKARVLANEYLAQTQQQYGFGPRAATAALELAHKAVRAWEQEVGKAYYEREVNQINGLARAPREPGAAGSGAAQQQVVGGLGNVPNAVTSRFFGQP